MSDYTTREISLELEKVGFEGEYSYEWVEYLKDALPTHLHDIRDELGFQKKIIARKAPAYSASTLFEWLREKYNSTPNLALDIQTTEITIWLNIGHNPNEEEKEFEYKTNLADMLASAIIWILKEESK